MNIRVSRTLAAYVVLALALTSTSVAAPKTRTPAKARAITIGIVTDGGGVARDVLLAKIREQAISLAGTDFDIRFPEEKLLSGEFDKRKITENLDSLLADADVTMVLAYGTVAGAIAGNRPLNKPVLAPFVVSRSLQNMPFSKGTSGRKNLSYIEFPWSLPRDIEVFHEVTNASKMTFLLDQYILDAIPGIGAEAQSLAKESKVDMSVLGVGTSAKAVLDALPGETNAVYMAPMAQLPEAQRKLLLRGLIKRRIATYSIQGEFDVRQGVLVGRRPVSSADKIARRLALDIMRIAGGAAPETLPVALQLPERLMINVRTTRAIRLSPSWRILIEAELIDVESQKASRTVSLESVMREALLGNVNIKALTLAMRASKASVSSARANLFPQVQASSTAQVIDPDRALRSPQYLWNGTISATQVLWSERAWAGLDVQKSLQEGKEHELETGRLDVAGNVAVAYLNVIRAKTQLRIHNQNLKSTRANLETSRAQYDAGAVSKADVYRWESQIANDRRVLVDAAKVVNIAEVSLQTILNRPLEERFETSDELAKPTSIALLNGLERYLGDPWTAQLFREFLISESLANSPELQQIDSAIAVQERLQKSASRALYSPTVAITGQVSQRFYRGGDASAAVPGEPNGTDWFAGLTLSVPIYEGGRYAEIKRNELEVGRLQAQRQSLENSVAQRAAAALHQMSASYASISLSQESAEAAKKSYDLVASAYAQGAVRIINVIDAQNAWFISDRRVADAGYQFITDWMNVQRAMGQFTSLMGPAVRAELIQRVNSYIAARKQAQASSQ